MKIAKFPYLMIIALVALVGAFSSAHAQDPYVMSKSLLFNKGDFDSKYYRIPALATANDGTVIAVADKRINSCADLPADIDVVCKISKDNGLTWSDYITVVAHDENGGYGDPALVVDEKTGDIICIATHGEGLWSAKGNGNYARIVVMRSKDNGLTWGEPVDITDQIFSNDGRNGTAIGTTSFATSGRALQTKDGKIMFALIVKPLEKPAPPLHVYAIYSDDGGYTWKASPKAVDLDGDEAKLVELQDGRILMSIRNRHHGPRRFSESTDGGVTWSPIELCETLIEPACNGDIISVIKDGEEVLYHTIPADLKSRVDVSLFESNDQGKTWEKILDVYPGKSAYSSITMMEDGTMGCLVEEEASDGCFRLWFSKIKLD